MAEYYGHRTFADGSHEALTQDEAEAIWKRVEELRAKREAAMPTAQDALSVMIDAQQRLRELGWAPSGGLRVKRGDDCAVAQIGSTGMWRGYVDAEGKYVHFGDSVAKPRDVWLKPFADLSPDERAHMEKCDQREAEAYTAMLDRCAALQQEPKP